MEYFEAYGQELAQQFCANGAIKRFASNTAVIGAYAEATVMKFARSYLAPIHVSTGTVMSPESFKHPKNVPQVDSMLWSPCPLPAIFEADGFALVPQMSCLGILEIKRSAYTNVPAKIQRVLAAAEHLVRPLHPSERVYDAYKAGLGVVCLLERDEDDKLLKMIDDGSVVALSHRDGDEIVPVAKGIHAFIHFLNNIRARYHEIVGATTIVQNNPVGSSVPENKSLQPHGVGSSSTGSNYKIAF